MKMLKFMFCLFVLIAFMSIFITGQEKEMSLSEPQVFTNIDGSVVGSQTSSDPFPIDEDVPPTNNISGLNQTIQMLIPALCVVESSGNHKAIGDNGESVGILQIKPIMVKEVNRILGQKVFKLSDRLDAEKSKVMARVYLQYWGRHYDIVDAKSLARLWNGGSANFRSKKTLSYWSKVQLVLTKREEIYG